MKTKRYVVGLAMMGTLGLAAALVGSRVRAQSPPPIVATGQFGVMGAIRGEIVRLSVSNINLAPPDPCHATLEFVDLNGDVLMLANGTPVRRKVELEAGHSAILQFLPAALLQPDQTRLNFRPVLLVQPDGDIPPPCVPSLEFINGTTGQTRLAVPGSIRTYSANHNETLVEDR
jgi:hypothetical protein